MEHLAEVVNFEAFGYRLEKAIKRSDGCEGGRPPYNAVAMFNVLILAAQNAVSDARMEFPIRDRLSGMRFRGFAVTDAARHDGHVLRQIVSTDGIASNVWADIA